MVTKHGIPLVEMVPVPRMSGTDFDEANKLRREPGLDGLKVELPENFDDPAFSRQVLGLPGRGC